ncbi:MAG: hypothetical protein AB1564_08000 [Chloroflexota bacterium]
MGLLDSPYLPGRPPGERLPLARFLPPLEDGVAAAWLALHAPPFDATQNKPGAWVLDPFGSSPRLAVEAARAGYRVLVTANNPVTRFLLDLYADPASESDLRAALADLAVAKKGDERLESHLQSLYLTPCANCGQEVPAQAFLWKKGEDAPYARIYTCPACGDNGERPAAPADLERAARIAATAGLHRARLLERVAPPDDPDREYAEEALANYLPRALYALATLINRLDSPGVSPERRRLLSALFLSVCDSANSLWPHPTERPRPKQLTVSSQFREHNIWLALEEAVTRWAGDDPPVPLVAWPAKIPESGGVILFEGRIRDLAEVVKEAPIAAVVGALPRPNQAFWTLSALWAGWLWGREAAEPFKVALRRRRYDWAWNATALHAACTNLFGLLALGTPFLGFLPEPEPAFLTSALTAASSAGFDLKSLAARTEFDPIQLVWQRGAHLQRETGEAEVEAVREAMHRHLAGRGEPARYLYVHAAGLLALTESHALRKKGQEFDDALRGTQSRIETALKDDPRFIHFSTGENVDTGLWGLKDQPMDAEGVSLSDRVEMAVVTFLQKNPSSTLLEIEADLYPRFPGLFTPSKGIVLAVLNSYAEERAGRWQLRPEDQAASRRAELARMEAMVETLGTRLGYATRKQDRLLIWEENGRSARVLYALVSALVGRALTDLEAVAAQRLIVLPGGRAALATYKAQRDPSLAARLDDCRFIKFRLLRQLVEIPILTRQTFEEQIAADPLERAQGQRMMF